MFSFEHDIFINRPVQEVFDFISNPANDAQWISATESSEWTSEAPPGVGSTIRVNGKFLGRRIEATQEIISWAPPNEVGFKMSKPVPFEVRTQLDAREGGTNLTLSGQGEFGGFFKLAEGLVGNQMNKQMTTDLSALKLILEAAD